MLFVGGAEGSKVPASPQILFFSIHTDNQFLKGDNTKPVVDATYDRVESSTFSSDTRAARCKSNLV